MPFIRPSARFSFVFPPFHFLMLARSFGHMLSRSGHWDSERWRDSAGHTAGWGQWILSGSRLWVGSLWLLS